MTTAIDTIETSPMLSAERIAQIQELAEQGLVLSAYRAGLEVAPLHEWRPLEAQIVAGRLAQHLGSPRLGNWILRCAYRSAPDNAEAIYYYGYCLWHQRGPYAAWKWAARQPEPGGDVSADTRGSWYGLRCGLAATLRDFDAAEAWLARATQAAPDNAWVKVCQSQLLELLDRYDDALAAAREALDMRPWYRPALQAAAHLLTLLARDEEALALLTEGTQRLENGSLVGQLYLLQIELRQHEAAARSLDRMEELSPLMDKPLRKWLAAQRAEVAYYLGDTDAAIRHAREADVEYWKAIAARLEDPVRADSRRVLLPVGFVRQHHLTCVPATLTAISRYWSMSAEHLQVADEICYNGTSHYSERKWATQHGWAAREFSVTEDSAVALLDRGIPFTFTTVDPANAHLQAIIGYDGRRGTLHVRDPYFRNSGEAIADKLLERYRAYGPRGMALVPQEQADKLAGIDLPDAALWDELHAFDAALVGHRREEAQRLLDRLLATTPDHRLALEARRRLAIYDSNPAEHLAAVERLAEQFPDDPKLQFERLALLRNQARRDERLAIYARMLAKKDAHPIFWQQYAQELRIDARRHDDAVWLLRRAIRRWPTEGGNYYILASIYWDQRQFDEALELYRFAACLNDKDEHFIQSYFAAAGWFKQTDQVLRFLHDRFERFGRKSADPAMTLASAYMQLDRAGDALTVIDQALALRPDDGALLLYAADLYAACSTENLPRTRALLAAAQDKAPRGQWLQTAARLAQSDGRLTEALALWRNVLALQPLDLDAHSRVARLLAETEGTAAALAYLKEATDRFPHHYPLLQLWLEWLRDEPDEVREQALFRVVEANADDAWVRRELGFLLGQQRRFAEAWEQTEIAGRLDPNNPSYHLLRSKLLQGEDRIREAMQALREAIELSVDNDYAVAELMGLCATLAERREALAFVKQELVRQVTFGDGLLTYREHARGTLDAQELLADLRQALAARPDLWHGWSAMAQHLLTMNELDEAWQLIQQATDRFPLLPRLWLDRALVCRARRDFVGELEALETAYRINPQHNVTVRMLVEARQRRGEYAAARELLERAVAHSPLDALAHIALAEALWHGGEKDAAIERVERAIQIDPGYERAWECLDGWSKELKQPERSVETARRLCESRGGEARSWLLLARVLDAAEHQEERLAAVHRAIELSPRWIDAHDMLAIALAAAGRGDEARAACHPPVWNEHPPIELRVREAWLSVQQGELREAIDRIEQVLQEEPHYYPGWLQMAEWCRQAMDAPRYLRAAEALVRISPHYEVSLGFLAEAREINGDREGAMEVYRHAFELNPQYEFAGNCLFDYYLEQSDLAAAARTIEALRAHSDDPFVLAREGQLAARRGNVARTAELLEQFCTAELPNPWPLEATVQALVDAGATGTAREVLDGKVRDPAARPEVGDQWARVRSFFVAEDLRAILRVNRPAAEHAAATYARHLCETGQAESLRHFVQTHADWLRESDFTWGSIGSAFSGSRDYPSALKWMADWRQRPGAEAWMLVNTIEALRAVGRRDEAVEVSRVALAGPPHPAQQLHHLWLAVDAAADGDAAAAAEHLANVNVDQLTPDWKLLGACALGVLEMNQAAPEDRGRVFAEVRRRIAEARKGYAALDREPGHKRALRQCACQIARLRGTWTARLWYAWIWLRSYVTVA